MASPRSVILMYHRVSQAVADVVEGDYALPTPLFEAQMRWLAASGRRVTSLGRLADPSRVAGGVILTFDDGCDTDATVAAPLLTSLGLPATFFVSPARVGLPGYVSWDQLRSLGRSGFVVGSHGLDHSLLGELPAAELHRQLLESKRWLEEELGSRVEGLSLPGGSGGRRELSAARDVGYRFILGSRPGFVDGAATPMILPRIAIRSGHGMEGFRAAVEQGALFDLRQRLRHGATSVARRLLGTTAYARLRAAWLRRSSGPSPER